MDMENKVYFSKQKGFEFMKTIKYYLEYSQRFGIYNHQS